MRIDLLAGARILAGTRPAALPAIAAGAIAAGLAACSPAQPAAHPAVPPAPHPATASTAASHAPARSASPPASTRVPASTGVPASTDVHACFDGKCRVTVTAPITIPVDPRFGFSSVRVTVSGSEVTVTAHPPGGSLDDTVLVPGDAALNGLTIDLQAVTNSTVTLTFNHH